MRKLTIKRSEWLRGIGAPRSYLVRTSDNKMCCLGFLGCQVGLSSEEMANHRSPADLPTAAWPDGFVEPYSAGESQYVNLGCRPLMEINDNRILSEEERESQLTQEFKKFGIEVEFVD